MSNIQEDPTGLNDYLAAIQAKDHFKTTVKFRGQAPQDFFSPDFDDAIAGVGSLVLELLTKGLDIAPDSVIITLFEVLVPPAELDGAHPEAVRVARLEFS